MIRGGILSAQFDPGAAVFAALKGLLTGQNVFLAPDGPFGRSTGSISVLGAQCTVADGAAFLAFEAKARVACIRFAFDGRCFSPVLESGPRREGGETFDEYRGRLYSFYQDQITLALTGVPSDLALSKGWMERLEKPSRLYHERTEPDWKAAEASQD